MIDVLYKINFIVKTITLLEMRTITIKIIKGHYIIFYDKSVILIFPVKINIVVVT